MLQLFKLERSVLERERKQVTKMFLQNFNETSTKLTVFAVILLIAFSGQQSKAQEIEETFAKIKHTFSGKCLDVSNTCGLNVVLFDCLDGKVILVIWAP